MRVELAYTPSDAALSAPRFKGGTRISSSVDGALSGPSEPTLTESPEHSIRHGVPQGSVGGESSSSTPSLTSRATVGQPLFPDVTHHVRTAPRIVRAPEVAAFP